MLIIFLFKVLYSQTSTNWINVNDLLCFLEITDTTVTFIWASEETGFRHLYLITSSLVRTINGITTDSAAAAATPDHADGYNLVPRIISKVALTYGEWEVVGRNIWYDSAHKLVYFLGLKETPLEKHLYVVSLQNPGYIRLLTVPGNSYSIDFNDVSFPFDSIVLLCNFKFF